MTRPGLFARPWTCCVLRTPYKYHLPRARTQASTPRRFNSPVLRLLALFLTTARAPACETDKKTQGSGSLVRGSSYYLNLASAPSARVRCMEIKRLGGSAALSSTSTPSTGLRPLRWERANSVGHSNDRSDRRRAGRCARLIGDRLAASPVLRNKLLQPGV